MKVERAFAPLTITLESSEDVQRFTKLMRIADNYLADVIAKGQFAPTDFRVQSRELSYDLIKYLCQVDV